MWPFQTSVRPGVTRRAALESRPKRRGPVESSRGPEGRLLLTVRRREEGVVRFLSLFLAIPRKRTYELDERGEWFWGMCDGTRSVGDLSLAVAAQWEMGREAARQTVFHYLALLIRRGLIEIEAARPLPPGPDKEPKDT